MILDVEEILFLSRLYNTWAGVEGTSGGGNEGRGMEFQVVFQRRNSFFSGKKMKEGVWEIFLEICLRHCVLRIDPFLIFLTKRENRIHLLLETVR